MSGKGDGGAAFPSAGVVIDYDKNEHQQGAYEGMSLRDYFAGKALGFAMADPFILAHTASLGPAVSAEMVAEYTYRIADAMLAERAK